MDQQHAIALRFRQCRSEGTVKALHRLESIHARREIVGSANCAADHPSPHTIETLSIYPDVIAIAIARRLPSPSPVTAERPRRAQPLSAAWSTIKLLAGRSLQSPSRLTRRDPLSKLLSTLGSLMTVSVTTMLGCVTRVVSASSWSRSSHTHTSIKSG